MVSNVQVLIIRQVKRLVDDKLPYTALKNAAGVFAFMSASALPKLCPIVDLENKPLDLTENFIKSLEWLMLAQAQECVWQRAVTGNNSPLTTP